MSPINVFLFKPTYQLYSYPMYMGFLNLTYQLQSFTITNPAARGTPSDLPIQFWAIEMLHRKGHGLIRSLFCFCNGHQMSPTMTKGLPVHSADMVKASTENRLGKILWQNRWEKNLRQALRDKLVLAIPE